MHFRPSHPASSPEQIVSRSRVVMPHDGCVTNVNNRYFIVTAPRRANHADLTMADCPLCRTRPPGPCDWCGHVSLADLTAALAVSAVGALKDIAVERQRQIEVEGWTPEHDDAHDGGEMAAAAACYAMPEAGREGVRKGKIGNLSWSGGAPRDWPWGIEWWKPTTQRRDLIKAAALIVAEIERLDRAALARAKGETP